MQSFSSIKAGNKELVYADLRAVLDYALTNYINAVYLIDSVDDMLTLSQAEGLIIEAQAAVRTALKDALNEKELQYLQLPKDNQL